MAAIILNNDFRHRLLFDKFGKFAQSFDHIGRSNSSRRRTMDLSIFYLILVIGYNYDNFIVHCSQNETAPIYAVVVHRHGDRTPLEIYPTDPYQADTWPIGLSQLTNKGKELLYNVGLFLKNRYQILIGQKYNVSTITVLSSDKDRTIMSVQSLLAAMYPPEDGQVWNQHINWQPIPVHTIADDDDNMLGMTKQCPKYNQDMDNLKNIPEVGKILENYCHMMEYVSKYSGYNLTDCGANDFKNITSIYDTLSIELKNNLTLPNWTHPVLDELRQALPISFGVSYYTPDMQRLTSGVILKEILQQFIKKSDQTDTLVKNMTIYSAHDSTIVAILSALKSYNWMQPSYGTAVLFELHEDTDKYIVKVFYRNDTNEEPYLLNLPDCPAPCTIDAFAESIKTLLPTDWDEECRIPMISNNLTYVAVVVIIMLIIMAIIARCCLIRHKKMQKTGYISYD